MAAATRLHAPQALLEDGWHERVLVEIEGAEIVALEPDTEAPADAERAAGAVIPGMPNLHSHAFQRALAGLTEHRGAAGDGFWSWREAMYAFLARLGPEEVEAIAAWLYVEMLEAGYTAVGEFHYLHHDPEGRPYANPAETAERVLGAATETGIGITLLPALYAHGDFGGVAPEPAQCRFVHDADGFAVLLDRLRGEVTALSDARLGMALHSLRAVEPDLARAALDHAAALDPRGPVHVHAAEQRREVERCLAWCGRRPVEWLLDEMPVDERWCLVHATHLDDRELRRLATAEAVVGLCPSTEANLGDGLFRAEEFLAAGGRIGIGSDSHVSVSPIEELRLLEYGQRLAHRRRAVLAGDLAPATGRRLWQAAAAGGARALGRRAGGLAPGLRADLVVLDPDSPLLAARGGDALLDSLVFSGNRSPVRDVMVAGRWRVREGLHPGREPILARYRACLDRLIGGGRSR